MKKPPKIAKLLLHLFSDVDRHYSYVGDVEEEFSAIFSQNGFFRAYLWYWSQVFKSVPSFIIESINWSIIMFNNYFKIAFRNIFRHKGYSFINISGLALGMACCLLITLWVLEELSYDRFHENTDTLYRVEQDQNYSGELYHVNVTPFPMAAALKEEIPEVVDATRYVFTGRILVRYGEHVFFEPGFRGVDPSFFTMFTFPFIKGDKETALVDPYSIVISEEIALKYFGDEEPVGKMFSLNNEYEVTVTGVFEKVPDNSIFNFSFIIPYELLRIAGRINDSWGSNEIFSYVQLHKDAVTEDVNDKISTVRRKYNEIDIRENYQEYLEEFLESPRTEFSVRPVKDISLYSYFGFGQPMGDILYVYIFSTIALFVLIIACINFMNLSTARSANRAKEIGMRKVVGAFKKNIIFQFYSESLIFAFISLAFSLILVAIFLPSFNTLAGKELSFTFMGNWIVFLCMVLITLFTGLFAGSYPALFLSAFKPVKVLRGSLVAGAKSSMFRKTLVIVQFSLSIFLIIGTGVVYKQLEYMKNKELGYDKDNLMYITLRGNTSESYGTLKTEFKKDPRIIDVSASIHLPTNIGSNAGGAEWDGKDEDSEVLIGFSQVDFDFIETLKIEMVEGRSFSEEFSTDTADAFLINEEVAKIMGKESPVGENFSFLGKEGKIVGVMKNFHFKAVRDVIEPLAIHVNPEGVDYALIRIQNGDVTSTVNYIKETWERVIPDYPFDHEFLSENFDNMYRSEERMGDLLKYFSILAILIASLGLFGLASYTAEQRTKEIGIRKVLGASAPGIIVLLCKEFLKLVVISNILAWPAAWYVMDNYQQSFAYRADVGLTIFAFAGILAVLISLITVSLQSAKAAFSNPVNALKYE